MLKFHENTHNYKQVYFFKKVSKKRSGTNIILVKNTNICLNSIKKRQNTPKNI